VEKQQNKKQWAASKYDILGRVIFTGITYIDSTKTVQSLNTDYNSLLITESYTNGTGYTCNNFCDADTLTINYYDSYDFISLLPTAADKNTLPFVSLDGYDGQHTTAKGLLTGTRVYHLDNTSLYETTAMYYDKFGRMVQTRSSNHLDGYDLVYNALDFTGKPTKTLKTHNIAGQASIVEVCRYAYDKAERLLMTRYKLGTNDTITLISNTYDELGRLTSKQRHTGADTESFGYNIRNWTTKITSGSFEENLYYNSNPLGVASYFNGNIGYSTWTYNGATKGYAYTYDNLNRLTLASFKQGTSGQINNSFNENFTFDKMGNITALQRKKDNVLIDDLSLHYANGEKSNQLQWVDDGVGSQNSYTVKEYQNKTDTIAEFAYDANGNMIKDLDRDIYTIQYNLLNLPDVVQFKNGNQIKNTYNAGGQKLGTEYFTWLPGANAPVVNTGDVLNLSYLQNTVDQNGTVYIGNVEYNTQNGNSALTTLSRIYNTEGYVENPSSPQYYYYRKDHLGNNREVWLANTDSTVQRTQYYPSGLPMTYNDGDNPGQQRKKYNGKEFDEMHGYDTYDYGARGYYAAIGGFMTVDPLAEKHYNISPYVYCAGNPVRFIDPTGMLEDVYINGTEANAATEELQKSTSMTLTRDDNSGKISASGEAKTIGDKKLLEAINSTSIKVDVNATKSDKNISFGGAFMGNTVTETGNGTTVVANQEVNPYELSKMSDANQSPGQDILHEVTEAFEGAKISQVLGVSSLDSRFLSGSVYKEAHNLAIPQSGIVYLRVNDSNGNQIQDPYKGAAEDIWSTTRYLTNPRGIPQGLIPIKTIK